MAGLGPLADALGERRADVDPGRRHEPPLDAARRAHVVQRFARVPGAALTVDPATVSALPMLKPVTSTARLFSSSANRNCLSWVNSPEAVTTTGM